MEQPGTLGNNSLFKMEQRLYRMGVLDRALLAAMTGSAGAGPRGFDASGLHKKQHQAPAGEAEVPVQAQLALGENHRNYAGRGSVFSQSKLPTPPRRPACPLDSACREPADSDGGPRG